MPPARPLRPAAQVVITNQLSANLNWSTFQLQQIYFNNAEIQVPPGLQDYTTQVYVATDPNPGPDVYRRFSIPKRAGLLGP